MENLSHSLPKKSYRSNGFAGKTVYDDVFGAPPKFGVPTLSPRVEDYSEIFEGFHASRGSSIPILDLPAVDDDDADLFFDVRSSEFDYSEVFGGFNGLDFAVSYEELFKQSTRGDDSSDEAWTPAQSESLSDESDPSACSEKNQSLSYGDLHNSLDGTKQFNISYHKAAPKGKEDMLYGVTHVTQLDAIPGYSFIVNETLHAQKIEDENSHLRINQNTDFGGGVTEGKRLRKTVSQPPNSDFGVEEYESEPNPLAGQDKASSPQKAFISVSDISLRTQPSHLPPPSRPPPAFTDRKGNSSRLNSKLKASKSYAFERMESDSSPPYFDVEIDASSSAAASAAAMKNAVEKAQAQLRSAKELMERKEGLQSRTKLHLENDLEHGGEKTSRFDRVNSCKGERVQSTCEREGNEMKTYAAGQRKKVRNTTHVASGAIDGEDHIDIAGKSAVSDHGKENTSSQVSHKTEGTVAWREETQFYEVVKPTKVKDKKTLEQHSKSHDCGPQEKGTGGALEHKEYNKRAKAVRVDHEWEENGEQFEELKGVGGQVENKGRRIAAKGSTMQEEHQEKANLAQKVSEWQEKEKKTRVSPELGETEKRLNELDKREDCIILTEDQLEVNEVISEQKLKGVHERVEYEKRIKKAHERKGRGREIKETFDSEEYERELKEDVERVGNGRKLKKALELGAKEEREKEVCGREEIEKKPEEAHEIGQKKEKWEEALGPSGKAKRSKEVIEQEESGNGLQVDLKPQENKKEKYWACEERNEKKSKVALEQEKNTKKQEKAYEVEESEKRLINDCERDETEKRLKEAWKQEENNKRSREDHESDESEKGAEVMFKEEGTEDGSKEANERVDCNNRIKDDNNCNRFSGLNSAHEQIKREETDRNLNQGIYASVEVQKASDGACTDSPQATQVAGHDKIHGNLETQKAPLCEENGRLRTEPKICEREMEAVEKKIELIEGRFNSYGMDQSDLQHEKTNNKTKDSKESLCLHDSVAKSKEDGDEIGGIHVDKSKGVSEIASDTENAYIITHKHREGRKNINGVQIAFDQGENRDKFVSSHVVREWVQHGRKVGDVLPAQKFDSQSPKRKETNFNEKLTLEEREKEERLKRERDLEDDRLRKIEEEKEREREREKDRMAVDTATREARERALAEARDRAERAAVERATAEVRQRALADARERLEKASAEARERLTAEKVSTEARLKAERAAVERATSEARERAFEKAMAEKASFAAHERMERSVSDNFSAYSRNGGLRHSSSSSDLQYGVGSSRDLKYSYSSVSGLEGESAQRCKARLERHQRTAERAAKALAEKNMRDLLAHKEQAERNRLAESLDADVKRWSSGKEGNLRALLSTLQYILGHDSGWKPIPLTDVITAVAVKKAYRKATLFVHPDKLQQRGASIQQKYICEKVFDLLKEAWNKFNSEER